MKYNPDDFSRMIRDSGMTKFEIAKQVGISRSTLDSWLKPENQHLLTIDRILRVAKATRQKPANYFADIEHEARMMVQEPEGKYDMQKQTKRVSEYFEDIILKLDGYRDQYIKSLQHNIQLQDQVIIMLREKLQAAGGDSE